jgi:uncharacterized protein YqjF (DUF2071 family)
MDATSLCAVLGARIAVGLPYFWAAGREHVRAEVVDYRLRRRVATPGCHLRYTIGRYLGPAVPQTVDHFLLERYLLHVQRGPSLWTIRVRHQPYPLRSLNLERLQTDLVRAAGIHVEPSPSIVHFAAGVDVAFLRPHIGLFHHRARNQPV